MPGDRYEQSTQSWLGQYGASGLPGSNLPTLAGSRLCVAAGGSRVDARLVCGMTLVVTVHEVAGRYLAGGWWIRRESGMERRAHRLAAIVKGLSTLSRSSSCICYHISPGDSADARRASVEAREKRNLPPWAGRNGKAQQETLLSGLDGRWKDRTEHVREAL